MRLSDAEWKIMGAVWDRESASARDVWDDLHAAAGWEYSTVRTMLNRLVDKGALRAILRRNAYVYEPLIDRDDALRAEVRSLADRAFGGTLAPLVHFLLGTERLTKADRDELRRVLDEIERGGEEGKAP